MKNRIWSHAVDKVLTIDAWWSNDWIAWEPLSGERWALISCFSVSASLRHLHTNQRSDRCCPGSQCTTLYTPSHTCGIPEFTCEPSGQYLIFACCFSSPIHCEISKNSGSHCELHSFDATVVTCSVTHSGCGHRASRSPTVRWALKPGQHLLSCPLKGLRRPESCTPARRTLTFQCGRHRNVTIWGTLRVSWILYYIAFAHV